MSTPTIRLAHNLYFCCCALACLAIYAGAVIRVFSAMSTCAAGGAA